MASVFLPLLTGITALLWLLWYFIPLTSLSKGGATLLILAVAVGCVWKNYRPTLRQDVGPLSDLPPLDTQQPIVLVCGEGIETLFQESHIRKTAEGWWLRVEAVSQLSAVVQAVIEQQPRQVGLLSVMYVCLPDQHQDEAVLRASFKALRQQVWQMSSHSGLSLPVLLNCEFSGPATPWIIVRGDRPLVCQANESPIAFADWQQTENHLLTLPLLGLAFTFIRETGKCCCPRDAGAGGLHVLCACFAWCT